MRGAITLRLGRKLHCASAREGRSVETFPRPPILARVSAIFITGCLLILATSAHGQEALRLSLAGETAAQARHQVASTIGYYNLLLGPVSWRFSSGLGMEYNDNIRLQENNPQGDFIFRPNVNAQMHWPVTDKNSLDVSLGLGYSDYLNHQDLNQFNINPGSGVAFDIYIGDFAINLHDRISITQNSYENPGANGTGNNLARLENTAGASVLWDLNKAVATLGYEHAINMSLGSGQQQQPEGTSENVYVTFGARVRPEILVGVEAGGSLINYDQSGTAGSPNAMQWHTGVFCQAQISEQMSARLDAGYTVLSPETTSTNLNVSESAGYYFQFSLSHNVNKFLNYTLSAGRSTDFQFYGQAYSRYFARLQPSWHVFKNYSLSTPVWWEHGTQTYNQVVDFDQFGAGISIGRQITKKLSGALSYQLVKEISKQSGFNYTANIVGLNFSYQF